MFVILAGMGLLTHLVLSSYHNEVLSASSTIHVAAPTPTPTPVIVRPGWNIFSNPQFAYSIEYPPTVKPTVNLPSDVYLHFVTFTTIPKNEEGSTPPVEVFAISIRKDSLENEVAFQRSRIEGHGPVTYQGQRPFTHLGHTGIQLDYGSLSLISISRPPVVFTIYFPNLTDASFVNQILETLLFLQ